MRNAIIITLSLVFLSSLIYLLILLVDPLTFFESGTWSRLGYYGWEDISKSPERMLQIYLSILSLLVVVISTTLFSLTYLVTKTRLFDEVLPNSNKRSNPFVYNIDELNPSNDVVDIESNKEYVLGIADELEKLNKLNKEGVLTDEDFQVQKKKLLS